MTRTQVNSRNVRDESLTGDDIQDGSIMESELDPTLVNDFKFVRHEFVDLTVPQGYSFLIDNHLRVAGNLTIRGRVKIV